MKLSIPIPKVLRRKRPRSEPGARPGTLVVSAELPKATVDVHVYDGSDFDRFDIELDEIAAYLEKFRGKTVWLDVRGLGDGEAIRNIGDLIGLHPLTIEDIVNVHQRPKHEDFEDYMFIVLRAIRPLDDGNIDNEQISLVVKSNLLVTFQERPGDVFEPVRRRLREGKGHIRKGGADYLAYALIDSIIDVYYPVVEAYTNVMDQLDDAVREDPKPELSRAIHALRREMRLLRRAVWPLRDVMNSLSRDDVVHISKKVRTSFRDCHDHIVQVSEFIDGGRERASELADLFMVMVSEKTNQVMKVLTIIATIFIPLTFLCGLYGMNFDGDVSPYNMPELRLRYGYPIFWGVMIVTLVGMILFFRSKGWLGARSASKNDGEGNPR